MPGVSWWEMTIAVIMTVITTVHTACRGRPRRTADRPKRRSTTASTPTCSAYATDWGEK